MCEGDQTGDRDPGQVRDGCAQVRDWLGELTPAVTVFTARDGSGRVIRDGVMFPTAPRRVIIRSRREGDPYRWRVCREVTAGLEALREGLEDGAVELLPVPDLIRALMSVCDQVREGAWGEEDPDAVGRAFAGGYEEALLAVGGGLLECLGMYVTDREGQE